MRNIFIRNKLMKKIASREMKGMKETIMTDQMNRKSKTRALGHKSIKEGPFRLIYNQESIQKIIKKDIFKENNNKTYSPNIEKHIIRSQITNKA